MKTMETGYRVVSTSTISSSLTTTSKSLTLLAFSIYLLLPGLKRFRHLWLWLLLESLLWNIEACVFLLQNQIIFFLLLLCLSICLEVHCFLLFLFFFLFGLFVKPVDDVHHVVGVGIRLVVQIHKLLLLNVKQSEAFIIKLNLEKLLWLSLRWQLCDLLLLLFPL